MGMVASQILAVIPMLAIALPLAVIVFFILKLMTHSRHMKKNVVAGTMIGMMGRAESEVFDAGIVFVRGELWHACAEKKIARGESVRVIGFSRLALKVEQLSS